ncbi:hypothetical protein ABOZ73_16430 [Caulobacter sp. 73W]|uniref:Uncharacterized protein n=1 Tax=Caulobacter sp. 73W TaxID=3161137 RepID=A0AB39KRQ0_9CAUL
MIRLAAIASMVVCIAAPAMAAPQEINAYTRYELLAPGSGKFRIIYDVTAARPGATAYFNPIRKGSIATDESVVDMATGKPLEFKVVDGATARATGLPEASLDSDYIRVTLARPVPADGGQGRVRIDKTYEDAKSYFQDGQDIVFDRPLGVKRNAVVLPAGYVLVTSNYPSQVAQEADGRLRISFINNTPAQAPVKLRARPGKLTPTANSAAAKVSERARQTRDIVYFLNAPETHSFALHHDYTEDRPGVGQYVNVVRKGSTASKPSARNMDTGEALTARQLKGAAITAAGIKDPGLGEVTAETEVVLFSFPAVKAGESVRLRLAETYTDPGRYKLVGDELVFDRALGRPANAVVLPAGWTLTNSAAPVVVSETEDGRTRLDFINPALGDLPVLVTAKRK